MAAIKPVRTPIFLSSAGSDRVYISDRAPARRVVLSTRAVVRGVFSADAVVIAVCVSVSPRSTG